MSGAAMTSAPDAIVIGAGVIGASVAYELTKLGWHVTSVEKLTDVGAGSTSASSAVIRFHYSTYEGVVASWEAKFGWEQWRDYLEAPSDETLARFHKTGCLILDGSTDRERTCALFDRVGIPWEAWDADTIRRRIPGLDPAKHGPPVAVSDPAFWVDPTSDLSGYFTPDGGFVDDPQLAARNLIAAAQRRGCEVRLGEEVVEILQAGGHVGGVRLAGGDTLRAPVVVNVTGPYSATINELAGVLSDFGVRTRPLRQEVHSVTAPEGYSAGDLGPVIMDGDLGTYFRSHFQHQIIVGGTEPACDPLEFVDDPNTYNVNPTQRAWEAQVFRLARRIPSLPVPPRPRGTGALYDVADDWIPIYDRTSLGGFYVAIGTSGNQFKNAPVVGHFMATLISACEAGHDHDADPVVADGRYTEHSINLGHYSRLRQIHGESSFNVMG
jgi:sarcosine oxidase, subunit beta